MLMTLQQPRASVADKLPPVAPAEKPAERRITAADFWAMVDPDAEPKQRSANR